MKSIGIALEEVAKNVGSLGGILVRLCQASRGGQKCRSNEDRHCETHRETRLLLDDPLQTEGTLLAQALIEIGVKVLFRV